MPIAQADLARSLGINPQRITKLIDSGVVVRLSNGLLTDDSHEKAQEYLSQRDSTLVAVGGRAAMQAEKTRLQCEKMRMENDVFAGKLHSKVECCKSLLSAIGAAVECFNSIGANVQSKYPEISGLREVIQDEVDSCFCRLRDGLDL